MAPPTGPRGGQKQAPRAPRGGARGGIGKRYNTPRTDRDGDVSMDSPAQGRNTSKPPTGPSGRGRGGSRGRSTRSSTRLAQNIRNHVLDDPAGRGSKSQHNKTTLKILGLKNSKASTNSDGGVKSLLDFLERKSSREKTITLGRGVIDGDYVWVKVNKDDAPDVLRLNGYAFAGAPLTIEETTDPMPGQSGDAKLSQSAMDTRQKLTSVLASRYNAEQKLLDLSALGADQTLTGLGTFGTQSLAEKSFKALVHLAGTEYKDPEQKNAAIQAVSLARNEINDVGQVYTLAFNLPRLRRLDLSGNKLENFSRLSKWRHEFRFLEELHLSGNPVVNQPNYSTEITSWFPSLRVLDGQQVRTPEEAAAALKASFPTPLPSLPSNLRDGDNNVATAFLCAFFPLFDHDRPSLVAQFYDEESYFSVTFVTDSPSDPASESCLKFSRNIQKLGARNPSTLQRTFSGGNLIADLWKNLPPTRHPSLDQSDQWLIDGHTFPHLADPSGNGASAMGLIINVNGQCEEAHVGENIIGTRTFSRCIILGPSKPGAPHPYRVLSDHFTLHSWTSHDMNMGGSTPAPAPAPVPEAPAPQEPSVPDDATKLQMVQELSKRTGMNAHYSELCLAGAANWNFDIALQSFEALKANLPAEAFVTVPEGAV